MILSFDKLFFHENFKFNFKSPDIKPVLGSVTFCCEDVAGAEVDSTGNNSSCREDESEEISLIKYIFVKMI